MKSLCRLFSTKPKESHRNILSHSQFLHLLTNISALHLNALPLRSTVTLGNIAPSFLTLIAILVLEGLLFIV